MKNTILFLLLLIIISCNTQNKQDVAIPPQIIHDTVYITNTTVETVYVEKENDYEQSEFYISEVMPRWVVESGLLSNDTFKEKYKIDNRLNPLYLEEDFNGDGFRDFALPIMAINSKKMGFVIFHGESDEFFIIGAGKTMETRKVDDYGYIDHWSVNRKNKNEPGLTEKAPLLLKNPSIRIEVSELGGGLLYWNGSSYAYFHQTC